MYLSKPAKGNGGTLRDELTAVSKMRGKLHPELEYPEAPGRWNLSLRASTDIKDFSYFELKAYCEMTSLELTSIEVDAVRELNSVRDMIRSDMTPSQVLEAFGYGTHNG